MYGRATQAPLAHRHTLEKPSRLRLIPALTVMVFMRRRIGDRMLMLWLLPTALALYAIQPLTGRSLDDHALRVFAVLAVLLGIVHWVHFLLVRHRGEARADAGLPPVEALWHSYDRGESWLSFLPLPAVLVQMVLDPALCAWLGWMSLQHYSAWLGYWLLIGAGALFFTEFHDRPNDYHRSADIRDGIVEGQRQSEAVMGSPRRSRPDARRSSRRIGGAWPKWPWSRPMA